MNDYFVRTRVAPLGTTRSDEMELTEYPDPSAARIPDYCRDLRVFGFCDEDGPVVVVMVEELVREERIDQRNH